MGMTSLAFAAAARSLGRAARLRGLVVPVFASPPARADLDRSIRRRNGAPLVAVRLRGRPCSAVLADMIEGIVVASYLSGSRADVVRAALWLAVDTEAGDEPGHAGPGRRGIERGAGDGAQTTGARARQTTAPSCARGHAAAA